MPVKGPPMPKPTPKSRFKDWKPPKIEHGVLNEYNWLVLYPDGLTLEKNTDIGAFCLLMCKHGVVIDENAQLGSGVKVYSEDTISGCSGSVIICERACIGANSVILPNAVIRDGAIVAANSTVSGLVPKNEIWAGNPAKQIGKIIDGKRRYFSRAMWPETMG